MFKLVFCTALVSWPALASIIFVQLGPHISPSLLTCIAQARYFNEERDIYLLTDPIAYSACSRDQDFFTHESVSLVDMSAVCTSTEHLTFCELNPIDKGLDDGFWNYALERFFYLFDFIQERGLTSLVHLENDTMLYVALDELDPFWEEVNLAAPFQSFKECIPSFVFIKNKESLQLLLHYILNEIKEYHGSQPQMRLNDMSLLARFYLRGEIMPLPTLMADYFSPKRECFSGNRTPLSFLSKNSSLFKDFIFDAATLGVFTAGNDPKYFPNSGPGTVHYRSLFDPRLFTFVWGNDAQGRPCPFLLFKQGRFRIVNLHFHSKRVEEFSSFAEFRADFPKGRSS